MPKPPPLHTLAERIRRGDAIPLPLALLLSAATPVQRLGMWRRLRGPRTRVEARVISFGNLTTGGTGKTPAVIARAMAEVATGRQVAVLTRGYGSARGAEPLVVGPMDARNGLYARVGDEGALIARRVPEAWIVKSADRVQGALAAIARGCDTLILDDGFQAVALERDENILLLDARNPFGNGHLVPRGVLREPVSALARATEIVLTRCDTAEDLEPLEAQIRALVPGMPVRRTRHVPQGLWRVCDGETMDLDYLRGRELRAVCGIAQPESFYATLESLGARIVERRAYPDHAALPPKAFVGRCDVVLTEKDAMRLESPGDNVFALAIGMADWT